MDFDEWYRSAYPRVVSTLELVLGSADEATDASAEAFLKAHQRWDRVRVMERPDGWVYRVALNQARRWGRRRSDEAAAHRTAPTSRSLGGAEAMVELAMLLDDLPHRMRQVVALRYVADLTESSIAEVLGISRSTVSSTLRDAHQRLEPVIDPKEPAT